MAGPTLVLNGDIRVFKWPLARTSRWVAFMAACATLLRAQRRLRLTSRWGHGSRRADGDTLRGQGSHRGVRR
ncbi:hypothetical protein [Methylibium sp.]|uniref:hypothetical protein n=1 Tax=Methylibium sp. TaxID=2067992 RepID=UPI00345C0436